MNFFFKTYWFLIFARCLTGFLLLANYLLNLDLIYLFKIPLVLSTIVIVIHHFKNPIYTGFIFNLFVFYLITSMLIALVEQNFLSSNSISHLYALVIGIFGVSFGWNFAKSYSYLTDIFVRKIIRLLFIFTIIILSIYIYFYFIDNKIPYYGFDSEIPLLISFFLGQNQFFFTLLAFILLILSGKRSPLITTLLVSLVFFLKNINFKKFKSLLFVSFFTILLVFILFFTYQEGLLWRYEILFDTDLYNRDNLYIATSGRSAEFFGVFNHMNESKYRWITGSGIGGTFFIDQVMGDYLPRFQHYTHLSLLSYVFIFGIPFTLLLIFHVIHIIYLNFDFAGNKYYLALIASFIASMFGAGMLVDSFFWVLLGINTYISKNKNLEDLQILKY